VHVLKRAAAGAHKWEAVVHEGNVVRELGVEARARVVPVTVVVIVVVVPRRGAVGAARRAVCGHCVWVCATEVR